MKIFLRPITINDSHLIVKWRNNSTVLSHCMSKIEITEESHLKFFKENIETLIPQHYYKIFFLST